MSMYKNVLTKEQVALLPIVKKFAKNFYLVGGTAIALQLGHRESIDFDLFTFEQFYNSKIKRKLVQQKQLMQKVYTDEAGQFAFIINNVQFTFFQYPFKINALKNFDNIIKMPDLLTLAAMKAYALGRRVKWKDYVDLYFIIEKYHSVEKIITQAENIFKGEFNARLFREQLSYFNDINYTEIVNYMPGFEMSEKKIKKALINFSLS